MAGISAHSEKSLRRSALGQSLGLFQQQWQTCRIFSLILARFFKICGTQPSLPFIIRAAIFNYSDNLHFFCLCCRRTRPTSRRRRLRAFEQRHCRDPRRRPWRHRDRVTTGSWLFCSFLTPLGSLLPGFLLRRFGSSFHLSLRLGQRAAELSVAPDVASQVFPKLGVELLRHSGVAQRCR